jgi:hypothetical protein
MSTCGPRPLLDLDLANGGPIEPSSLFFYAPGHERTVRLMKYHVVDDGFAAKLY